jgi:FtsP/CotA-like multicopper oxidase with cupredoxin domain
VELGDGVFPLWRSPRAKQAQAFAVVRTSRGAAPGAGVRPAELDRWLLTVADLEADAAVVLGRRPASRSHRLVLAGDMQRYRWTINGRAHHHGPPLQVREGERVRLLFENRSPMWHPMHLHGHTFQLQRAANLRPGPRKDTVIVRPAERVAVEFDADNPGRWMVHCHNAYHQAAGMMTTLATCSNAPGSPWRLGVPRPTRPAPLRDRWRRHVADAGLATRVQLAGWAGRSR